MDNVNEQPDIMALYKRFKQQKNPLDDYQLNFLIETDITKGVEVGKLIGFNILDSSHKSSIDLTIDEMLSNIIIVDYPPNPLPKQHLKETEELVNEVREISKKYSIKFI